MTRWRFGRLGLPVLLAGLLVGCSLVGMAYNSADRWLLYQADSYLDLRDGQREQLRSALRQRLAEHRAGELADYVDFLDRVLRAAGDGLDAAEVDALAGRLQGLVRTTFSGTLPAIAGVLATLEPAQVDHLQARLADDDRRYRKGAVQPTAQRRADRRAKTAVRALEHWTGELTATQRVRVSVLAGTWPDLAEQWHAYRVARTSGLIELLRGRPATAAIERYLASRWLLQDWRDAGLGGGAAALRRGIVDLIVEIDGTLTATQRAAFLKRVRAYRDDLAGLLPSTSPAIADARAAEAVGAAH